MSPRANISMSRDEIDEFLETQDMVVVGSVGEGEFPAAALASCRYTDGVLVVTLPEQSAVLSDLRVDARLCCIAETFASYYEIKGVVVHGRADVAEGEIRIRVDDVVSFDFSKLR